MKTKFFLALFLFSISFGGWAQRSVRNDQMVFTLSKLYIQDHTLSFELVLTNHSLLGYTPAYIKFFIRDRHVAKRTAVQERELAPLETIRFSEVKARDSCKIIFPFYQFTLPRTKELAIQAAEKDGARVLELHIKGRRLLRLIRQKG